MEGRGFPLGHFLNLAVQLGGGCLIDLGLLAEAQNADSFQNPQNAQRVHVAGILRHVKGHLNVGLCSQIVNLIRLNNADDPDQAGRIGQIAIMELDLVHDVIDACSIGNRSPAGNAVNFITLLQQELSKIAAVLAGDAGDECFFHVFYPLFYLYFLPYTNLFKHFHC